MVNSGTLLWAFANTLTVTSRMKTQKCKEIAQEEDEATVAQRKQSKQYLE